MVGKVDLNKTDTGAFLFFSGCPCFVNFKGNQQKTTILEGFPKKDIPTS